LDLLRRLMWAGLLAGIAVGLAITAVQTVTIYPLLREAEVFEAPTPTPDHTGDHAHAAAWEPAAGVERLGYSALTNVVLGGGFGLLLVGAFGLRDHPVGARRGCLWGAAGFFSFALAPALGLPPAVPGAAEAALGARQLWWLATAAASAAGLSALVFGRAWSWRALGLVLIVAPHAIGAPHPGAAESAVPADLARQFIVSSLATSALFWLALGTVAGWLYARLTGRDRASPTPG
jgi:cobalt transporter subunit CbtA